jgi:hypothetical protein
MYGIVILLLLAILLIVFAQTKETFISDGYYWPSTAQHWYGGYGGTVMQPRLGLKQRLDPYF